MDFLLTDEQKAFRAKARDWLPRNLPEGWLHGRFVGGVEDAERGARLRKWENSVHAAGFVGLHWPKQYGGHGLTLVEHFIFGEEVGRIAAPEGVNPIGRELVAGVLLHAGREEQKLQWLPRIAACEDIWCQGFSEPNAGSDLTSLRTRAEQRGGKWVINGQKIWTSYAQHADMCLLLARTSADEKGSKGLSLIGVPMTSPGITRRGIQQLDGAWDFNEVFFDNVEAPLDNVIGPVGEGWATSGAVLAIERATTRLYRQMRFLNELQHACVIAESDGGLTDHARQIVARSFSQLIVLRALNTHFVSRLMAGEKVGPEASVLKQCWSHFHQDTTAAIAELIGHRHWFPGADDGGADRFVPVYFHAKAETILAGATEVQKDIIAERVLGLPRRR